MVARCMVGELLRRCYDDRSTKVRYIYSLKMSRSEIGIAYVECEAGRQTEEG